MEIIRVAVTGEMTTIVTEEETMIVTVTEEASVTEEMTAVGIEIIPAAAITQMIVHRFFRISVAVMMTLFRLDRLAVFLIRTLVDVRTRTNNVIRKRHFRRFLDFIKTE